MTYKYDRPTPAYYPTDPEAVVSEIEGSPTWQESTFWEESSPHAA